MGSRGGAAARRRYVSRGKGSASLRRRGGCACACARQLPRRRAFQPAVSESETKSVSKSESQPQAPTERQQPQRAWSMICSESSSLLSVTVGVREFLLTGLLLVRRGHRSASAMVTGLYASVRVGSTIQRHATRRRRQPRSRRTMFLPTFRP